MLLNSNSITNLWLPLYLSPPKLTHLCDYGYKNYYSYCSNFSHTFTLTNLKCSSHVSGSFGKTFCCRASRRVRYEIEDDEDDGYNEEIAMLETYSESARGEALLVTAMVDDQEVEVIIFKGFSSSLSYGTSADPSKSVLPQRAIIKFINRIRGPFDPTNIDYIEKGITWETFRSRLRSN